ncbi:MAG TPA: alginate lyase family protein [Pyrinomonadaceae bacterium]|nr:alginate lyase family protein [Pyrinomonadaceae bacterium]
MSNSAERPNKSSRPTVAKGIRAVLGGNISFTQAMREGFRRGRATAAGRRERALLADLAAQPARLLPEFQKLSSSDLLKHFRARDTPSFLPGFEISPAIGAETRNVFPDDTRQPIEAAWQITKDKRRPLMGFGLKNFGNPINWLRDPLSGRIWPLDYHADISLWHNDGSDIRVLWELNRLGHLVTLGRAYALTKEEQFAGEFFAHVESWHEQNPLGRGANWSCAMEVALRSMNLLGAFSLFRGSPGLDEARLALLLRMFDQHGAHIKRNLEFSYVATSNHYLSDVAGLLWLGIMLPELGAAQEWRAWALAEMLREMDKQILPDGADYEGSTGYHRFVLELLLYSFILCRANGIPIAEKYWRKLYAMLVYLKAILRPDGAAPLIGDSDGGQVLPLIPHSADDHAYLLALGAAVFQDSQFKLAGLKTPPELLWILGREGLQNYEQLATSSTEVSSQPFPDAGIYILQYEDLYLLFNANGTRKKRPASHRHNDVLSIEVSAGGRAFIIDPGSYVYTANLHERHLFRSTAYHSTVKIDDVEQNTIREDAPFVIGDQASARVLSCESTAERDRVVAEHSGYERLSAPVKHRRTITFYKPERWWLIEDEILGRGEHSIAARFHFAAGLDVGLFDNNSVIARDGLSGAGLIVRSLDFDQAAELESQFTSRHYGSKLESFSACWTIRSSVPCKLRWAIVPVCAGEDPQERLSLVQSPTSKVQRPEFTKTLDMRR